MVVRLPGYITTVPRSCTRQDTITRANPGPARGGQVMQLCQSFLVTTTTYLVLVVPSIRF